MYVTLLITLAGCVQSRPAFGIGPHEGIRTRRHKLIHFLYGDEGWELYDPEKAPDELDNLYSKPDCQPLVLQLKSQMEALKRDYAVPSS